MLNRNLGLFVTLAITMMALSGCTGTDSMEGATISQEGSSTLLPLAKVWATEVAGQGLDMIVDGGGSGHGASGVCDGSLDIGDMSRAMKGYSEWEAAGRPATGSFGKEIDVCLQNGVAPVQWKVALDALTVVVNKQNTFVQDLTVEQLAQIFGAGSGVNKWSDLGFDSTQYIGICMPGSGHGTYGYFLEEVLEKNDFEEYKSTATGSGATFLQTNGEYDEIAECVKNDPNAIGFFGYSFFDSNRDTLNGVSVNGVEPTIAHVIDGRYSPLGRYLYMYTASELTQAVYDYLDFAFHDGQSEDLMTAAGFIPLDGAMLHTMQSQLSSGMQ